MKRAHDQSQEPSSVCGHAGLILYYIFGQIIAQEVSWPWSRPDWAADSPTRVKGQIIATSHD